MDTRYYVGSEPVIVDGELSDYAETTIGETVTFKFYIRDDLSGFQPTGGTYGGAWGGTYGGSSGFTYGGGTVLTSTEDRYQRLKDYGKYAGFAQTGRTLSDVYFYEDEIDFSRSEVDTLLVPIQPGSGIDEAPGIWGVIESVDDTTEIFGAQARIDLEVFVLAQYDEYSTESAVRNEFEETI